MRAFAGWIAAAVILTVAVVAGLAGTPKLANEFERLLGSPPPTNARGNTCAPALAEACEITVNGGVGMIVRLGAGMIITFVTQTSN